MLRKGGPLATPAGSGMRPVQPTTIVEPTSGSPPSSSPSMLDDSMQPAWGASSADDHRHASLPAYMDAPRSSSFESASPASAEPTIIQLDDVAAAPASADEDGVAIMTGDISKDGSSMRSRGSTAPADKPEKIHLTPPTARRMQKQAAAGKPPLPSLFALRLLPLHVPTLAHQTRYQVVGQTLTMTLTPLRSSSPCCRLRWRVFW